MIIHWIAENYTSDAVYTLSYTSTNTTCFNSSETISDVGTFEIVAENQGWIQYNITGLKESTSYTIALVVNDGDRCESTDITTATLSAGKLSV